MTPFLRPTGLALSILLLGCGSASPQARTAEPAETPAEPAETPAETPAEAQGTLSPDHIRTVVRSHTAGVRACYEVGLAENAELRGRLVTTFVVQPDGTVGEANVTSSDLGHPGVEACILEQVRMWRFHPPSGGGIVIVNYPFVLETE